MVDKKLTVGVTMVFHNELDLIKQWLPPVQEYADEIICGNHASTDGSQEYLKDQGIKIIDFEYNCLLDNGFSYMKNVCAEHLSTTWIHSLDADEMLDREGRKSIHKHLSKAKYDCVPITTRTYHRDSKPKNLSWETIISTLPYDDFQHKRLYKNGSGIKWKGYIHEELYKGDINASTLTEKIKGKGSSTKVSPFIHHHLANFKKGNPKYKASLYTYMLLNAHHNPELRKYTNSWWYKNIKSTLGDCSKERMQEAYKYITAEGKHERN